MTQVKIKKSILPAAFIRSQKAKLADELERLKKKKAEMKNFPDYGSSPDDAAQEVAEFSADNEIIKKVNQQIKDIKKALKVIENGNYGICQVCGDHIMQGRLKVMPEAITCAADNKKIK